MPKSTLPLPERLLRYSALAALTTGTSLLITPGSLHANSTIHEMGGCNALSDPSCVMDFDDPSGNTPEFIFTSSANNYGFAAMLAGQSNSGDVGSDFIQSNQPGDAAVLAYGAPVSDTANWAGTNWAILEGVIIGGPGAGSFGNWLGTHGHATDHTLGAYIGVKFTLDGVDTHYGWIEVHKTGQNTFLIQRIGYNTNAGESTPASVYLAETSAITSLRGVIGGAFAALAGVFTWLRRKAGN